MATLLESRAQHRRVRLLSRNVRESEVYEQDPPSRRLPVNRDQQLTTRQRGQRRRREREKQLSNSVVDEPANVCLSNIFTHSSVVQNSDNNRQSSIRLRREHGQRVRRERERNRRIYDHQSRFVSEDYICICTAFYRFRQILPASSEPVQIVTSQRRRQRVTNVANGSNNCDIGSLARSRQRQAQTQRRQRERVQRDAIRSTQQSRLVS